MYLGSHGTGSFAQHHQASQAARDAKAEASAVRAELDITKAHVERILMISEALWSILKEKHGYTDDELRDRVMEIDLADGRLDGKVSAKEVGSCSTCGRKLTRRKLICLYCGSPVQQDLFDR